MRLCYLFFLLVLTSACNTLYFEYPQPKKAKPFTEFPKNLQGKYQTIDSLRIVITDSSNVVMYNTFDSTQQKWKLNENAILKRFKNEYILNLKEDNGWEPVRIKKLQDTIIVQTISFNDSLLEDLQKEYVLLPIGSDYVIKEKKKLFKKLAKKNIWQTEKWIKYK